MSGRLSRRKLIGGQWGCQTDPIRPPWSLPEADFVEACTACGDCIEACPGLILRKGGSGYPVVDFSRGACDICGACAEACSEASFGAFDRVPWRLVAVFSEECLSSRGVTCRVCAEWCDAHAIRFSRQLGGRTEPILETAACSGCGACISVCPAGAIRLEEAE